MWGKGKKVGNLDWGYPGTLNLDLGKKVGNLDLGEGGVFWNFKFGLRKKRWKFGFRGVFWNFEFGLRKRKDGNLDFGGYSGTSNLDLGKKDGNLDFGGGGILELRIWT